MIVKVEVFLESVRAEAALLRGSACRREGAILLPGLEAVSATSRLGIDG